jgi:hypothetical protein
VIDDGFFEGLPSLRGVKKKFKQKIKSRFFIEKVQPDDEAEEEEKEDEEEVQPNI